MLGRQVLRRASAFSQHGSQTHICIRTRSAGSRQLSTDSNASVETYDVVCVGGGPAGLSLLAGLRASPATSSLKVALIEGQDVAKSHTAFQAGEPFANRCSSLTPSSVEHLRTIGAWERVNKDRVQAYQEMQVWDGVSGSKISFDWAGSGQSKHRPEIIAHMIENRNLTSALLQRVRDLGSVTLLSPARVESIAHGDNLSDFDMRSWPVVTLNTGERMAARLLVGADGANSPVRQFMGTESRGWDYSRHGLVATMHMSDAGWGGDEHKVAYQRFLPTGPIAMLPLPGPFATLVWSTTPERAAVLKSLAPDDFVAMVNAGFRLSPTELTYLHDMKEGQSEEVIWRENHAKYRQDVIPKTAVDVEAGTVASFPLKMRHADTYVGERVALVGDAAHTIHPLAGQGLNQGQGDAAALLSVITDAILHGADIGSQQVLEVYNKERYTSNNLLMGVVDKLHKLYRFDSGPIVPLRSFGLSAVDSFPSVKNFLMSTAASIA